MATRLRILCTACLLFGICVAPARGEPITVTSGQMTLPWDDPSHFSLVAANGLAFSGLFVRVPVSPQGACFTGCVPGTVVNMSSIAGGGTGFTLGTALTASLNGVSLIGPDRPGSLLELAGTFLFDAGDVVIPPAAPVGSGRVELLAPFLFQGQAAGFRRDDLAGAPLFDVRLQGQGTARLRIAPRADGTFGTPEVNYTFESLDPVPEPTTMLLVGTGAAGMLLRRWRKHRLTGGV